MSRALAKLFSPELHKCYFLYVHKQIRSKVPILLYYVGPKHPPGNCYVNYFLTDNTALSISLLFLLLYYIRKQAPSNAIMIYLSSLVKTKSFDFIETQQTFLLALSEGHATEVLTKSGIVAGKITLPKCDFHSSYSIL